MGSRFPDPRDPRGTMTGLNTHPIETYKMDYYALTPVELPTIISGLLFNRKDTVQKGSRLK